MSDYGRVVVKSGREKKLKNRYPWVQKGEVESNEGCTDGGLCKVYESNGDLIGIGTWNGVSRFPVRMLGMGDFVVDRDWFFEKFRQAEGQRKGLELVTNAWRSVFSEADGVPGLIVDRYGDHAVVQVRSLGMETMKEMWLEPLVEVLGVKSLLERSDMVGREEEGMSMQKIQLHGTTPELISFHEHGLELGSAPWTGLKTGSYLDQRNSRLRLRDRVEKGDKVLDCFCYGGGFSIGAAKAGGTVYGVDTAEVAIDLARANAKRNGLELPFVKANVFEYLEEGADALGPYDWIVLDPPAIAKTAAKRDSLKWGIWKLVYLALPLLAPGGRLLVCSCSYQLGLTQMLETCRLAAGDRGDGLVLEEVTFQDIDHPMPTWFPESLYLKCAWLRKS